MIRVTWFAAAWVVVAAGQSAVACADLPFTFRLVLKDRTVEGRPVAWNARQVLIQQRDGQLVQPSIEEIRSWSQVSDQFRPLSAEEVGRQLVYELAGRQLQVSRTANYVVAHPPGAHAQWALPIEQLHERFREYFAARSLSTESPQFPLVAVVFAERADFDRYAAARGLILDRNYRGFYCPMENRMVLYDAGEGRSGQPAGELERTIIHEAVHQSAFNTGVHSRLAPPPKWVSEGLAVMFEAPGVNDIRRWPGRHNRLHDAQLANVTSMFAAGSVAADLQQLVEHDRLFDSDPTRAYSLSWALTFYLAESDRGRYAAYLRHTAQRAPLTAYPSAERLADFARHFSADFPAIEARMRRLLQQP